jgi:hypothetical protein
MLKTRMQRLICGWGRREYGFGHMLQLVTWHMHPKAQKLEK